MSSQQQWRVLLCLFGVLFLGIADNQVLSPLLPAIQKDLNRSAQQLSLLYVAYSVAAGISVVLWGPLSDRTGRRQGLLAGLMVFAAGEALGFRAHSLNGLLAARIVSGMGASMVSLNVIAYAGDYFPYQRRGWAMGFIFSSYFAALILGVPLGAWLGHSYGWNIVFGVIAATAALLALLSLIVLPAIPAAAAAGNSGATFIRQLRQYLLFMRDRRAAGVLVSGALTSGGMVGFLAYLSIWMSDSLGVGGKSIGLVFLGSGIAALLASPAAGALSDRIGKRRQFWISSVTMSIFLLILSRQAWGPSLFFVAGMISLCAAFRQGPLEAIATEVAPAAVRGSLVALKNAFSQSGIALSAAVSGMLFGHFGYNAVCLWSAGCSLLAALGMLRLIREKSL